MIARPYATRRRPECALLALLLPIAGCAGPDAAEAVPRWQGRLARFVEHEAHGDLAGALARGDPPGFAWVDRAEPAESVDVVGHLLGARRLGGRRWFILAVAVVARGSLDDLRVAAVTRGPEGLAWRVTAPRTEAWEAYLAHRRAAWRARHGGKTPRPLVYRGFPDPRDAFRLHRTRAGVVVRERASGATWRLPLPPGQRAAPRESSLTAGG